MTYLSCLFVGGVCAPHCSSDMNSHNAVAFVDNKHIVFSPRHFYLKKTYIIHYLEEFYRAKTGDQTVFFFFYNEESILYPLFDYDCPSHGA